MRGFQEGGVGDAVRSGIKNAVGKHTIFMDADGSHTPEFIQNLYKEREGQDIVVASRYIKNIVVESMVPFVFKILFS